MPRHWPGRRFIALVLPVLLTVLALSATPGVAAQVSIGSYHADEFDFYFFFDAAIWELVERASEPGVDYVRLEAEQARLEYLAFEAPGMTVEECMIAGVQALADDPAILHIENLYSPGAPPRRLDLWRPREWRLRGRRVVPHD
jgi:hypothetical protein